MAASIEAKTCGSCCVKMEELLNGYKQELGLKGNSFDGTRTHAFGSLNFYLEHSKFTDLLNSIRSKCQGCTGWPDPAKAIRASLERQQQMENLAPIKGYISECLDKLQNAMKDSSIKGVVQRLEAITRKVGLKFIDNGTGRDCFINSDMFYVEVQMEADGKVSEVKVAHAGDPESCPELTRVLREGDYDEFLCHLQGLCDLYQLSRDTFQKSKILAALKAVEIDINTMAALFGTEISSTEAITRCPVGFVTPRQGGRLMRLTYFASPYELLDVNRPGQDRQFNKESPPPRDFGYQVCVSLEQSQKSLLPTMPLIEDPMSYRMLGWDPSIKYQALNDNNSEEFQASFVLQLSKPLPAAVEVVQKIYDIVSKSGKQQGTFTHSSKVPIDNLIIREWLKEKQIPESERGSTYYANLPQHCHVYHVTKNQGTADELLEASGMGVLLYRIGFTHPSHIPEIIQLLRRQAMFNTLLTSVFRSHKPLKKNSDSKEYVFEIRASGPFTLTVTFEHPCTPGMAAVDFYVSPRHTVEASLNTVPGQPLFCSNDYISRVIQRCLSIPAAMRCIIRKAESVKAEDLPVKVSEELPLLVGLSQPTSKLANLSLQPSAALFGTTVGTPSNPNTPGFLGTSPSFTTPFSLETPSPTFSAFPFTSISPTFSSATEAAAAAAAALDTPTVVARQPEKKLDTPKNPGFPNLKITLKRKRDDEYVIEKFQLPEEIPKNPAKATSSHDNLPRSENTAMNESSVPENLVESVHSTFDLSAVSAANMGAGFILGSTFPDVAAGLDGSVVSTATNVAAMGTSDSIITSTSGLGIVPSTIEGLAASTDLFDIGGAGADSADLEGILQNLSGASHLPPGIVPGGASLDFDAGLGPGVAGLDVTDPGFDIDAAIDASAAADPSIAGTAGAFDVDSTLDFDLEHIAAVGGLPPDVTGAAAGMTEDLLAVSGLGGGDGSVDINIPGTSQPKL